MQTPVVKRSLLTLFEANSHDPIMTLYREPIKKIKKILTIEIPDTLESLTTRNHFNSRPRSAELPHSPQNPTSCRSSTSTPPRFCRTNETRSFSEIELPEYETEYDDYTYNNEFISISTKKCNRKTMEDRVYFEKNVKINEQNCFFGIFDGHRNAFAANFLQRNLWKRINGHSEFSNNQKQAIREAIYTIDKDICQAQDELKIQGGATALFAIISPGKVNLINVGDSRAVVIRNGFAIGINKEHTAIDDEERKDIEARGGYIFEKVVNGRVRHLVQGSLEVTRSLGDRMYKKYISCEPDIYELEITEEDEYLILASDGLWNEMSDERLVKVTKAHGRLEGLSEALVNDVLSNKKITRDNISLIVIDLNRLFKNGFDQRVEQMDVFFSHGQIL